MNASTHSVILFSFLVRSSESYHLYFITKEGELYKSIFPQPDFVPEKEQE
jgi:hypothetical protein